MILHRQWRPLAIQQLGLWMGLWLQAHALRRHMRGTEFWVGVQDGVVVKPLFCRAFHSIVLTAGRLLMQQTRKVCPA